MSKYQIEGETERIEYKDSQWIDIYIDLNQYAFDRIIKSTSSLTGDNADVDRKLINLVERIKSWSFTQDDNSPLPVNKETIAKLPSKYLLPVISRINELNKENQEFSKK